MSRYNGHIYDTIVCFGDSLTQHGWDVGKHGWTAQLSQAYLRRLDVVNRGFSGYNTRWTKFLLPQILPITAPARRNSNSNEPLDPPSNAPLEEEDGSEDGGGGKARLRLLTVFFGANDAHLEPFKCHVPLDEFRTNIEYFVLSVTSPTSMFYSKDTRVVLITPPPLGEKLWARELAAENTGGGEVVMDRLNENTKQYAEAVKSVAEQLSVPCIDLWSAIEDRVEDTRGKMEFDGYEQFSWDGLHLNARGNDLLFELLMKTIRTEVPELDPEKLPFVVPDHRSIAGNEDFNQLLRL
ncbi:SGNH hydrolase [Martensiomyces pterosporus]|nr:SGNH hydrolase [Martensiomyces pterosporus]